MQRTISKSKIVPLLSLAAILVMPLAASAQSVFTISNSLSGTFVASGSAANPVGTNLTTLNFGGVGTLAIASPFSTKGEFDSVLMFSTASAVGQFNSLYGAGNWTITGIFLSLASNFGTQGTQPGNTIFNSINTGIFGIDWLGNNSWNAGTGGGMGTNGYPNNDMVSYESIPQLFADGSDSLGTYNYAPPGNGKYATYNLPLDGNLVSGAVAGGDVSFYFYAPTNSQVSYLFNDQNFSGNHPELILDATPTPEPATVTLFSAAAGALLIAARRKRKS